jgi:hypothetical protein
LQERLQANCAYKVNYRTKQLCAFEKVVLLAIKLWINKTYAARNGLAARAKTALFTALG